MYNIKGRLKVSNKQPRSIVVIIINDYLFSSYFFSLTRGYATVFLKIISSPLRFKRNARMPSERRKTVYFENYYFASRPELESPRPRNLCPICF